MRCKASQAIATGDAAAGAGGLGRGAEELDGVGHDLDLGAALAVPAGPLDRRSLPTTATSRPLVSHSAQVAASLSKVTMSTKSALSEPR